MTHTKEEILDAVVDKYPAGQIIVNGDKLSAFLDEQFSHYEQKNDWLHERIQGLSDRVSALDDKVRILDGFELERIRKEQCKHPYHPVTCLCAEKEKPVERWRPECVQRFTSQWTNYFPDGGTEVKISFDCTSQKEAQDAIRRVRKALQG